MRKRHRHITSIFFLLSLTIHCQTSCVIKPGVGLNNIIIGVSTIDSVINEFGHNKINKIWHNGVEADKIGRYEYSIYYKDLGITFSSYALHTRNPDQIIKTITVDSNSSCKTINGIGIGSNLKQVRTVLRGADQSYFYNKGFRLAYTNMDIIFKGKDTGNAKVFQIVIQNDYASKKINGKTYNFILNYDSSNMVRVAGIYIPGTLIKDGEWLFFYKNGQVAARSYFVKDFKRGAWITYDENGKVLHVEKKNDSMASDFDSGDFNAGTNTPSHINVIAKTLEILITLLGGHHSK